MTRQYEGDPQPSSPKDWFCRDCLTVSYYPPLDPKGHLNGRLLPKSFATLLSLAKNHEIVILSSQLWGRGKTPHQKIFHQNEKKLQYGKEGSKAASKGKNLLKAKPQCGSAKLSTKLVQQPLHLT